MLERLFNLRANGTNVKTEILAGVSTFLTMAYIVAVNPGILSQAGMPFEAVFVATCIAAAIGSCLMGALANYPVALAPGMGLNAFFTFGVVLGMGHSWQIALGCVFWSGILFVLLSAFKVREWIINAIPASLKTSISVGIGLFLAIIGLQNAGIVVDNPATLVGLGQVSSPAVLLTFIGFIVITALHHRSVTGSVVIGMGFVTLLGVAVDMVNDSSSLVKYDGIVAMPTGISATFLQLDIMGAIEAGLFAVIFAFLFVDLFDTSGTLVATGQKAGLADKHGNLPRLGKALMADSSSSVAGSLLGTSTTTSYIESSAGIAVGGRTGLTAITTGLLFLAALFFAPLAKMIPVFATSAALLFVAVLMISAITAVQWDDLTESAPVVVTAVMMPLTYSIAEGIALGFLTYTALKVVAGNARSVSLSVYVISALAVLKYVWL